MFDQKKDEAGLSVTIDLSKAIGAHSTKEFIQRAVKEAIVSQPQIIASQVQLFILQDLLKSEQYDLLKKAVGESISKYINEDLARHSSFTMARDSIVKEAVLSQKQAVQGVIANKIQSEGFKEGVSAHISKIVKDRVMLALGEVCDGCERDYY